MEFVIEPAKKIPVYAKADICVVGGSATGVFAAVRAARLSAKVILIEKTNALGGVATNGLVNVWHTFYDTTEKKQIIAGLSQEIIERLKKLGASDGDECDSHFFNPNEMKIELDTLLAEHKIKCCLHTLYAGLIRDGDRIDYIIIENKDGRSAVKADFYIDATGDGDLARDLGLEVFRNDNIQPPTPCFLLQGSADVPQLLCEHVDECSIKNDWGWWCHVPGLDNITMQAATHVFGRLCSRADDLTAAEIEGRRHMREIIRLLKKYGKQGENYQIAAACTHIGIRETNHYNTKYQIRELTLLLGDRFDDAVLNGTYCVDVHHADHGITFKYFDGTYSTENADGSRIRGNWRRELNISADIPIPTYYQVPFKLLVNETVPNFIAVGRMINADTGAFGALRVMVNLNQLGEAAGVGAYTALHHNIPIQRVDGIEVAKLLQSGGSANLG